MLTELTKLRKEIRRRDGAHQEELQRVTAALTEVQQELQDLKSRVASPQDTSELCAQDSLEGEIQSLRTSITAPDSINNLSYADVARTPPTSQPGNIRTLSSSYTTLTTFTDTL